MNAVPRPTARAGHALAYDSESDRVILFGGRSGPTAVGDETWTYDVDVNVWTRMNPPNRPSARFGHAMVYAPGSDRVILFGGLLSSTGNLPTDETWAYDFNADSWTRLTPSTSPFPRAVSALGYDQASGKVVLFGGNTGVGMSVPSNETWAYDPQTGAWTAMNPTSSPSPRERFDLVYVSALDRVVLFGGMAAGGLYSDETWTYDLDNNTWTEMNPAQAPSPRQGHRLVYDAESDRVLLFAGDSETRNDETWAYDLGANEWTKLNPAPAPMGRTAHRMAYDIESDRTVVFGGEWPFIGMANDETWAYGYNTNTWTPMIVLPSAPQNLATTPGTDRIDLAWSAPSFGGSSAVSGYRIYRGTSLGTMSLFAYLGVVLTYRDTNVTAGTTYYYQVVAVNEVGESPRSNLVFVAPSPDTTSPTVAITAPATGATLTATAVTVMGTAADDIAVEIVELSLDGTSWIPAAGTISWSGSLTLQEGSNTISARATDTSGNQATTSITVTVEVPPPPTPTPGVDPLLLGFVAAGVAAAGVIAAILMRRRRQ